MASTLRSKPIERENTENKEQISIVEKKKEKNAVNR
jgi:hypothetical protein